MRKNLILFIGCLILLAAARIPPGISVEQTLALSNEPRFLLIDARTPEEYAEGHIKGAVLIPIDQIEAGWKGPEEDHHRPIVIYCTIGVRSTRAMKRLKAQGYSRLYNLEGGIDAWKAAGRPVATQP